MSEAAKIAEQSAAKVGETVTAAIEAVAGKKAPAESKAGWYLLAGLIAVGVGLYVYNQRKEQK